MRIQVQGITGSPLVKDYLAEDPAVLDFFAGSPFDGDAYVRHARALAGRFSDEHRRSMADGVRPLGAEAANKLEAIRDGRGFFVTTGQQPGLFGGPMYTLHKALSAVALARRLESLLDAPVLALFWIASDDHDWAEANHVHVLDTANTLHRLELTGLPEPARSMGRRRLGTAADPALSELSDTLPPSDFTPPLLKQLRGAYQEDETVASAFTRTMAHLLDGAPLGLVDGQSAVVRTLGARVIQRELTHAAEHEKALREQTERLEAAGYGAQVAILPGASNVFHEDDEHGRERLIREDGAWVLRTSGRRLEEGDLARIQAEWPERLSANVVLRPVVESAVFPTLAYVGGPGEIRYLAQTRGLFEHHEVPMPLVYPRLSVTLVESKVEKVLDKFDLDVASFGRPVHELISTFVRDDVPEDVGTAVGRLRAALQEGYQAVFDAARDVDPTLKGPIFNARNEAFRGLAEVEKKVRQHVKLKRETELEQIEKAASNLAPLGKPQERVLNIHQYLARYGPELVGRILAGIESAITVAGGKQAAL